MGDILTGVVDILRPEGIWDIFIYIMFFMSLIMIVLIPEKNMQPTMLMYGVLLCAVIDKIRPSGYDPDFLMPGFDDKGFGTLLIHLVMFTFPLMAAGLIRGRGPKDKRGVPVGIMTGILGGVYAAGHFLTTGGIG